MRGNRAATRSVWAAACAVALLVPLTPPAAADAQGGEELRPEQWGMDAVGAAKAAGKNDGDGVLVALLDTGVDTEHPDLRDGVRAGKDFTEGAGSGPGESGTPLAGIIAGRGHGREFTGGIVGVAPGADLLSVRVAAGDGASGGSGGGQAAATALADGIRHAVDEGAQVVALTPAASGAEPDEAVQAAIRHANSNNVFVVAPAGAGDTAYPGAYKGATAVGAVGEDLALTAESPSSGVALTAPGADIRAPAAGGGYTTVDGTGAAAAFTAGAAALVRAEYPQLRPDEVADALKSSAASAAGGGGAAGYGAGVLDAAAAMEEGAAATQGEPLVDEDLAAQSTGEEQAVPGWMLWTGGALLVALGVAASVLVWRRVTANPYDLPSREPAGSGAGGGARSAGPRRAASGHRRGGRRRR